MNTPTSLFAALACFKQILEKARKRTPHELLRNTPGRPGAKLSIAATAMRAHTDNALLRSMGASWAVL